MVSGAPVVRGKEGLFEYGDGRFGEVFSATNRLGLVVRLSRGFGGAEGGTKGGEGGKREGCAVGRFGPRLGRRLGRGCHVECDGHYVKGGVRGGSN